LLVEGIYRVLEFSHILFESLSFGNVLILLSSQFIDKSSQLLVGSFEGLIVFFLLFYCSPETFTRFDVTFMAFPQNLMVIDLLMKRFNLIPLLLNDTHLLAQIFIQLNNCQLQIVDLIIKLFNDDLGLVKFLPAFFKRIRVVIIKVVILVGFFLQFLFCKSVLFYQSIYISDVRVYVISQVVILVFPVVADTLSDELFDLGFGQKQLRHHLLSYFLLFPENRQVKVIFFPTDLFQLNELHPQVFVFLNLSQHG
jgi:hypothetical protein